MEDLTKHYNNKLKNEIYLMSLLLGYNYDDELINVLSQTESAQEFLQDKIVNDSDLNYVPAVNHLLDMRSKYIKENRPEVLNEIKVIDLLLEYFHNSNRLIEKVRKDYKINQNI
jgi:hypothetical protein